MINTILIVLSKLKNEETIIIIYIWGESKIRKKLLKKIKKLLKIVTNKMYLKIIIIIKKILINKEILKYLWNARDKTVI